MTELISLPIVPGGQGAGVSTAGVGAKKTLIVTGVTGTINLEISNDGGASWCQVASFSNNVNDKILTFVAALMRVNAENGSASDVQVVAERDSINVGVIPAPPASGPGASLDTTDFGCISTIVVSDKDGPGSINIEVSGDDVEWSTAFSFSGNGCQTKDISARFVRAVGNNATGTISMASADAPAPAATAEVRWAQEAPDSALRGGNAFREFYEAHAECLRLIAEGFPNVRLIIDNTFATDVVVYDPTGVTTGPFNLTQVCTVGLRPGEVASDYDMSRILVSNQLNRSPVPEVRVTWADNARWLDLPGVEGYRMSFIGSSEVSAGIVIKNKTCGLIGARQQAYTSRPTAQAVYQVDPTAGFAGIFQTGQGTFSLIFGGDFGPSLAPVFDVAGTFGFIVASFKGIAENTIGDSVGGGFFEVDLISADVFSSYNQAGLAGSTFLNFPREAQPGRPIITLTGPVTYDATNEWGKTYLCDTAAGDVDIDISSASVAQGESIHVRNLGIATGFDVNLTPVGAEAVDTPVLVDGTSAHLESDGGAISAGVGRWVEV